MFSGDAEQADAERPYGGDEPAPSGIGMESAAGGREGRRQERGGLLRVIDGELASLRSTDAEPGRGRVGLLEWFVLGDLGGVTSK